MRRPSVLKAAVRSDSNYRVYGEREVERLRQIRVYRGVGMSVPEIRTVLAGPTLWPLFVALGVGVTFIGLIFTPWAAPIGIVLTAIPLVGWFWPRPPHHELLPEQP